MAGIEGRPSKKAAPPPPPSGLWRVGKVKTMTEQRARFASDRLSWSDDLTMADGPGRQGNPPDDLQMPAHVGRFKDRALGTPGKRGVLKYPPVP